MMGGYWAGYGAMGLTWWVIAAALLVIPFWRLLPKFGLSPYFSLLAIFPLLALILLWIIAFKDRIEGDGQ